MILALLLLTIVGYLLTEVLFIEVGFKLLFKWGFVDVIGLWPLILLAFLKVVPLFLFIELGLLSLNFLGLYVNAEIGDD